MTVIYVRLSDIWLNNYNGHPIIIKRYNNGVEAITSRRKQCDFVAIIGYKRQNVLSVLESQKLKSPIVKKNGGWVAIVSKGEYNDL